jgi:hypothetical protein
VAKAIKLGLAAHPEVLFGGRTAVMIADIARNGCKAVLIHTHGRSGIPLLITGSGAEDLLALTPVPLGVIHKGDHLLGEGPYTLAIDGSAPGERGVGTCDRFGGASRTRAAARLRGGVR